MRRLLLSLLLLTGISCKQDGPTGYKAGPSYPGDSYIVETCDEDMFRQKWWDFSTKNAIANTFVPSYKDYCTYLDDEYVFYWNTVEGYGYYDWDWEWYCANENTMKLINHATGDEISVRIYGQLGPDCHDIKITYGSTTINGELCGCLYNGP